MGLPKSCCCCLDLQIGCFILSVFACISYATTIVDVVLDYDAYKNGEFVDGAEIWFGFIGAWSAIGVFVVVCLVIGVAIVSILNRGKINRK